MNETQLSALKVVVLGNLDAAELAAWTMLANAVLSSDATIVTRLKAAGAIVIGKTNTPELTLAYEANNLVNERKEEEWWRINTPMTPSQFSPEAASRAGRRRSTGRLHHGPSLPCG